MTPFEAAALGWLWALIGACLAVRWGQNRPSRLILCALIWPVALWIKACEWAQERAEAQP